jgi:hypothetical protein
MMTAAAALAARPLEAPMAVLVELQCPLALSSRHHLLQIQPLPALGQMRMSTWHKMLMMRMMATMTMILGMATMETVAKTLPCHLLSMQRSRTKQTNKHSRMERWSSQDIAVELSFLTLLEVIVWRKRLS